MNKIEFLKTCVDDLVTHDKREFLGEVLEWVEFSLQFYPDTIEIDSTKTVEGAWKAIEKFAKDNNKRVLTPKAATKVILDYLGVKQAATQTISLDDFM